MRGQHIDDAAVLGDLAENTGIREEDRTRVFEPFFTTRPGGSGMGLATSYGVVRRAGGQISIESSPGAGTRVVCAFPRAAGAAPAPRGGEQPPTTATTVLVAEDEPMVREIVCRVLRAQGHRVIEAGDGAAALAAAATAQIGLLVTDVVMPRLGGRELAEQLREERPGLRVLFVSGYTDAALGDAGDPATAFLPKPFMAGELAGAVSDLLAAVPA